MKRRALIVTFGTSMILCLGACGSDAPEQAQLVDVTPTSVPTTAPLSVPTTTPGAAPTSAALTEVAPTPLSTLSPSPTVAPATPAPPPSPTVAPAPTETLDPALSPTVDPAADSALASDAAPTVGAAEVPETPTPLLTPSVDDAAAETEASGPEPESEPDPVSTPVSTPVSETPTAVVAVSGEPPLECFDRDVQVYRAFVDDVDELSFEGGRVYCSGAGTNAVSAAASYRHSSGLVVQRNADFIFNEGSASYIPYSGTLHFCIDGQPSSSPVRAETVPRLLVVIDTEAQRQLAQGATGPAAFNGGSPQC